VSVVNRAWTDVLGFDVAVLVRETGGQSPVVICEPRSDQLPETEVGLLLGNEWSRTIPRHRRT